jgi:hypothetical protein
MLALGGLHMELSEYSKEYRAHSSPKFWEKDQLDMRTEARIAKEEDRKPMSALDALLKRGAKLVGDDNLVIRGDLAPGEKAPEYMEGRGSPIGERGKTDKKSKSEVWEHYKKMLPVKPSNSMFSTDREHTVQDPFDSVKVGKRRGERHTPNRRRR